MTTHTQSNLPVAHNFSLGVGSNAYVGAVTKLVQGEPHAKAGRSAHDGNQGVSGRVAEPVLLGVGRKARSRDRALCADRESGLLKRKRRGVSDEPQKANARKKNSLRHQQAPSFFLR